MELSGTLIKIIPAQTGQGKNGTWTKQDFIVKTDGQYPKEVCFNVFNEKFALPGIGSKVTVSFDPASREYGGRYYTELTAWKLTAAGDKPKSQPVEPELKVNKGWPPIHTEDLDLPF